MIQSLIVVKFSRPGHEDESFRNAEVAIAQPGVFIIVNPQGEQLGMFPIGDVRGILFPEGAARIKEVTL